MSDSGIIASLLLIRSIQNRHTHAAARMCRARAVAGSGAGVGLGSVGGFESPATRQCKRLSRIADSAGGCAIVCEVMALCRLF